MCNSYEDLHQHMDRDQLTDDLGGYISYNHSEWIEQRAVSTIIYLMIFGNFFKIKAYFRKYLKGKY